MNASALLAQYERIADAPDAVVRLRKFVLALAVRGKLLPPTAGTIPDSGVNVGPEVDLSGKASANTTVNQKHPFDLPSGWIFTRLEDLSNEQRPISYGVLKPGDFDPDGVPLVKSQNVLDGTIGGNIDFRISRTLAKEYRRTTLFGGEILLNVVGSLGRCAVVPTSLAGANVSRAVAVIALRDASCAPFVMLSLRSLLSEQFLANVKTGTAQPVLNLSVVRNLFIGLPPKEEQHRIVAKVDELMDLCDRLEAARLQREATRDRLAASSLARLNTPDPETFQSDARFAIGTALPALTTRLDQIKQLRQTILNLAIQGKLVLQHEDEEPASKLLQIVAAEKSKRKLATKDARIKDEPNPSPASLTMMLPAGWAVQSFENLFLFIDYRGNTPPKTESGVPLITAKNIRMGYLNREPREFVSEQTYKAWMTRGLPQIGDLFFTTEAPLANICVNEIAEAFALAQRAICFQPYGPLNTKFVMLAVMSDVMQSLIDRHATGMTAKGIKASNLKPLPIPIPPLSEQHRIVAKVEELMALCDQLEVSLTRGENTRSRLLNALLHETLAPAERELEAA